jgi:hypothetical protein
MVIEKRYQPTTRRNCRALKLALCLLPIFVVTSCGGGSTSAENSSVSLDGQEPRIQLELSEPAQTRLAVTTTSVQNVVVGGEVSSRSITAGMIVDTLLRRAGDVFRLDVFRELVSFSPEDLRPEDFELARLTTKYNANGESLAFDSDTTIFDVLALDSYFLPALVLSSPNTPLGIGATWSERNTLQSMQSTTITTIEGITNNTVSIIKSIDTGSDSQNRYNITGTMSAVYSLATMLLESADISIRIRYEDQLFINGVRQPIVEDSTFTQAIREVLE